MPRSSQTGEKMVPVLYCDIDGTIRHGKDELGYFVNTADQVQVFEEVPDLLAQYKRLGWRIVGISNQGGIALGHLTMEDCARAFIETQKQCGGVFDKLAWCRHHPSAVEPEMAVCWCRKPKPGLIIEAAWAMAESTGEMYPPHMALFVGDREEDDLCAQNAGILFMDAKAWRAGVHLREFS
jgi:D-glycero-D-manno-heptose 1,7-bisphosphate phosphatase